MPFPYTPFPLLCTSSTELQGFSGNMSNMAFCMFLPSHDLPDFFCGRFSPVATQQQLPSLLPRLPAVDRLESLGVITINERITGREGMFFKDVFQYKGMTMNDESTRNENHKALPGMTRYDMFHSRADSSRGCWTRIGWKKNDHGTRSLSFGSLQSGLVSKHLELVNLM